MRFLGNTFGYFLASIIINGFWGFFTNKFGVFGGYAAALFLTGSSWYINHYLGLIKNDEDSAFIDMALGVGLSLITKSYILDGMSSIINSIPTFVVVTIGAVLGGYVSVIIEKIIEEKSNVKESSNEDRIETVNL